ncbi:MAG: hypothetical protein KKD01_05485 [Proteobacteria bacterium]|nr:hypothetical protein [Pseudomonadota bacterium]MBU1419725.1 hypothetical protein [Pseudomonadota bacterium]MBU1454162.1 hypothetical protein [Pseudomonadota bacterium]
MANQKKDAETKGTILKIDLEQPDFKGQLSAFVFDSTGNLLEQAPVKAGKVTLSSSLQALSRNRIFIAPVSDKDPDVHRPTLKSMTRLGAYSPVLRKGDSLIETIRIPDIVIVKWLLCSCWVRGRVIKTDSAHPVCGARVHICEVDKLWRWIFELPELEVFRLRDELIKVIEIPELRRPPRPEPDPSPIDLIGPMSTSMNIAALGPQPEPPDKQALDYALPSLPMEIKTKLMSSSSRVIRDVLVANLELIRPYLCLWPYWWTYRCDEIAVVETDGLGRFETVIKYLCNGDKPDLYFWVEYKIASIFETVYHPPIPCYTYWDYKCGTEVTLEISDQRVPSCDDEPDLVGCKVQIISIGRKVSMSEIHGNGSTVANEGLTTNGEPFGGKIEPRVWFSRTTLHSKGVRYYRWSYRRLTEGDGTPLTTAGPWIPMTRTVVRHYAKITGSDITHVPYILGPQPVGTESNLFEIKPADVPTGGLEWTVMDEREDLASAHFETAKLGTGADTCAQAFDGAGKYELKLELFKDGTGDLVDWDAAGINIDLEMTDIAAPFGTSTVTTDPAPDYNRIKNAALHTVAFRMILRVDNNCCQATIDPLSGVGLTATPCGFYEITPTASVTLGFTAGHPNDFATFSFSVKQGVTTNVYLASASGRVGASPIPTNDTPTPSHSYTLTGSGQYSESFAATELLDTCTRAAFSEALHVWTMAQDGYGRIWSLDRFNHAGFALTPP